MINYGPINSKLEELIKSRISQDGLVNTGHMRDSIKVTNSASGFIVTGVDYFLYQNAENNILSDVVNSSEFIGWMEKYLAKEMEKEIQDNLNQVK